MSSQICGRGTSRRRELDDYRRFVVTLTSNVAEAHREHGQKVSPAEEQAIQKITSVVGAASG